MGTPVVYSGEITTGQQTPISHRAPIQPRWQRESRQKSRSFIICKRLPLGFVLLVELAAGEKDATFAALTYKANVSAEADYFPFIRSARVLFSKANNVADLNLYEHKS
jgi:hypothetical protein